MDKTYNNQNYITEIDMESEIENNKLLIEKQINKLYDAILINFNNGKSIIYNPNIMCRLTREKFFKWIFKNNADIEKLFSQ